MAERYPGPGRVSRAVVALAVLALLAACHRKPEMAREPPVPISATDASAADGMTITHYPGPRGEVYVQGIAKPLKFGTTRDTLSYVMQPDVAHRLGAIYVQDVARIAWNHPSDAAASFIDARKAFYVAWQSRLGMMGPTFAPFAKLSDANAFARRYGGAVLTWDEITPRLVHQLTAQCPRIGSALAGMARERGCIGHAQAGPNPARGAG